jgi:hypothetical protein
VNNRENASNLRITTKHCAILTTPDSQTQGVATMISVERRILNRRLQFANADQVLTFLEREDTLWQWTNAGNIPSQVTFAIENYRGQWTDRLKVAANAWKANPGENTEQALASELGKRFQNRMEWCSEDPEAWQVHELAKDDPSAAAVAMAVLTGREQLIEVGQYENRHGYRRGRAKGYAILAGIDPDSGNAILSLAAEIKSGAIRDADTLRGVLSEAQSQLNDLLRVATDESAAQKLLLDRDHADAQSGRQAEFDKLKSDIEGIKVAYEYQMQLRGPVRYWKIRASQHRRSSNWALGILLPFLVIATGSLYALYDTAAGHLPATGVNIPYAALFKATAFAVLMTTIAFWVGRILLRMYLSGHHLATDAEERRTMIMTFLALAKSKSVEDADRKLILTALFRPGSDGIVKDDAAPEVGALIQNLIKR